MRGFNYLVVLGALVALGCARSEQKRLTEFDAIEHLADTLGIEQGVAKGLEPQATHPRPPVVRATGGVRSDAQRGKGSKRPAVDALRVQGVALAEGESLSPYPKDYPQGFRRDNHRYAQLWQSASRGIVPGEEMSWEIRYLGVVVGKFVAQTLANKFVGGREVHHIRGKLHSAAFYRYLYKFHSSLETLIDTKRFLPLKYSLVRRHSGREISELQAFNHQKFETSFWYRKQKGKVVEEKHRKLYIPAYFQNFFSVLYFVRKLPLVVGKSYELPLVSRGKIYSLRVEVVALEGVWLPGLEGGRKYQAIRVKAISRRTGGGKKPGRFSLWLSADGFRRLLKFSAQVRWGTVGGQLVRYRASGQG